MAVMVALPWIVMVIHEYSHYLAAVPLGLNPEVSLDVAGGGCSYWLGTGAQTVVVRLAGGLGSAVVCGLAFLVVRQGRWVNGWVRPGLLGMLVVLAGAHLVYGVFEGVGVGETWWAQTIAVVVGLGAGWVVVGRSWQAKFGKYRNNGNVR
jgi:hypothetical protein